MPNLSSKLLILALLLIVASGLTGYLLGAKNTPAKKLTATSTHEVAVSKLFQAQNANTEAKITAISGNIATIVDSTNQKANFAISKRLLVTKLSDDGKQTASTDPKTIEIGKEAQIGLSLIAGQYQIISVSYLPAVPPLIAVPKK